MDLPKFESTNNHDELDSELSLHADFTQSMVNSFAHLDPLTPNVDLFQDLFSGKFSGTFVEALYVITLHCQLGCADELKIDLPSDFAATIESSFETEKQDQTEYNLNNSLSTSNTNIQSSDENCSIAVGPLTPNSDSLSDLGKLIRSFKKNITKLF